jgi:hypothetical protein
MRKWIWVVGGIIALGAMGHYLAEHDPLNPYLSLRPDKIVEQGRQLDQKWTESNTPGHKGFIVIESKEVDQTRSALEAIKADSPQYAEAKRLLTNLMRHEETGKKALRAALVKSTEDNVDGRKEFARTMESSFLKNGMDVTLTTTGAKGTILTFRYVLVSRPFLYKLANETEFLKNCKRVGFTKVNFSNGYDASASYDLVKNNFD